MVVRNPGGSRRASEDDAARPPRRSADTIPVTPKVRVDDDGETKVRHRANVRPSPARDSSPRIAPSRRYRETPARLAAAPRSRRSLPPPPPARDPPLSSRVHASHRDESISIRCPTSWCAEHLFEVQARYAPIKPIGKGAYGVVCSARDVDTDARVAIKKIGNAFDNAVDAKRTLREIKLLRHLEHENVIRISPTSSPRASLPNFRDVYVMYELMDTDLHQIIRSQQALSDDHCQYFVYQLLRGLKYVHSAGVLHRDLKPSNLLLNANCDLKICDFGLARANAETDAFMTEYVVTRWYRARELLLSCAEYTTAIDVWSVGCIFAELLGRKPLFPGKDYVHQMNLIARDHRKPRRARDAIHRERESEEVRAVPPVTPRVDFRAVYPEADPKAVDLLDRMLVFDPEERIGVAEALAHPYLASLHDEDDEPTCATPFAFEFENEALSEERVRTLVFEELRGSTRN